MIKAIVEQLKTGSISNVFPRGQNIVNPDRPYVMVWESEPIEQKDNQGLNEYIIAVHFPPGNINQVDDYILKEVVDLLDCKTLTTRDGRLVTLHRTMRVSRLIEKNNDGTISRDRAFVTAALY